MEHFSLQCSCWWSSIVKTSARTMTTKFAHHIFMCLSIYVYVYIRDQYLKGWHIISAILWNHWDLITSLKMVFLMLKKENAAKAISFRKWCEYEVDRLHAFSALLIYLLLGGNSDWHAICLSNNNAFKSLQIPFMPARILLNFFCTHIPWHG